MLVDSKLKAKQLILSVTLNNFLEQVVKEYGKILSSYIVWEKYLVGIKIRVSERILNDLKQFPWPTGPHLRGVIGCMGFGFVGILLLTNPSCDLRQIPSCC